MEFVGGERERVHAERANVYGDVADRLNGIGMEGDAVLVRDTRQFADVLHGSDLVVGEHDGDECDLALMGGKRAL